MSTSDEYYLQSPHPRRISPITNGSRMQILWGRGACMRLRISRIVLCKKSLHFQVGNKSSRNPTRSAARPFVQSATTASYTLRRPAICSERPPTRSAARPFVQSLHGLLHAPPPGHLFLLHVPPPGHLFKASTASSTALTPSLVMRLERPGTSSWRPWKFGSHFRANSSAME